ncbi:hypothetical protein Q9966_016829, partial [Columba livia]
MAARRTLYGKRRRGECDAKLRERDVRLPKRDSTIRIFTLELGQQNTKIAERDEKIWENEAEIRKLREELAELKCREARKEEEKIAAFRVVGPGRPLPAAVGSDVVLPCRLSPKSDARPLEIRWIRHQFSETVHHYRAGEDQYGEQLLDYKGRTKLVRDGLADGDINLRITHVRPSDDGQYVCTVENGPDYQEATVELEVTAVGSVPHLSLESYEDGGIRMLCRSAGWYPQPEVLWRDPSGHHLPATSQRRSPDQSGLFAVEDAIVVTKNGSGSGTWSCTVRNSRFHQEQESSLHISAPFFDDARPFMAALGMFLVLSLVLTGLSAYLYRRKCEQAEELVWRKFLLPQNPDVVTLDTDTAHANLVLSNDLRSVRWESSKLSLPETDR